MALNYLFPALESLNYQTKGSPLALDLINLFQEVIDVRESVTSSVSDRINTVVDYFNKKAVKKLCAIIQKHTGIPVSKVTTFKTFVCNFAVSLVFGKDKEGYTFYDIIQRYSGNDTTRSHQWVRDRGLKPLTAEDMEAVANSFNPNTGRVGLTKVHNDMNISIHLYFDVYGAFLIKEIGHRMCEYLLADEITAIILHEIGHAVTTLEHSADCYLQLETYRNSLGYFLQNANNREKVEYTKTILKHIDPIKAREFDNKISTIAKTKDVNKNNGTNVVVDAITCVAGTFLQTLLGLRFILVRSIGDILFGAIDTNNTYQNYNKKSDYYGFHNQTRMCEQIADEYVARHGVSRGLIGGLEKLREWSSISGLGGIYNSRTSTLMYYANRMSWFALVAMAGDYSNGPWDTYDHVAERYTRAMQNTVGNLKNANIPEEMLGYFLSDYEICRMTLDNMATSTKYMVTANRILDGISYFLSAPVNLIFSGRFVDEYTKLFETTEKLRNNSIYYQAAKLKHNQTQTEQ